MTSTSHTTIMTEGGAVVEGSVNTNGDFIGRDQINLSVAQGGLVIIQQIGSAIKLDPKELVDWGSNDQTVVKLLQQGKQLQTYVLGQAEPNGRVSLAQGMIKPNKDVAILVDINRRILLDVAAYLDEKKIEATIIVVTNDPEYRDKTHFLDVGNPGEWAEIVQEFNGAVGTIKRYVGKANMHFFLSAPLPLAFGLGAVWGTVNRATVYHYENDTYHPVMKITRELRQAG